MKSNFKNFDDLNKVLVKCCRCPRLVAHRQEVSSRAIEQKLPYWRRPVPGYGDHQGWLLILGLAPSSQGGNRTGRIFTGDASAKFLMNCLFQLGFANQPFSNFRDDGLKLSGCYMTASVKCVPPSHHPTPEEFSNCSDYMHQEIGFLKNLHSVLTLGKLAFEAFKGFLKAQGQITKFLQFEHGANYVLKNHSLLYASYHPSPQNTNTGKLTEEMFCNLLKKIQQKYED